MRDILSDENRESAHHEEAHRLVPRFPKLPKGITDRVQSEHGVRESGTVCPKCEGNRTAVVDSRPSTKGYQRRRRVCVTCGHRWATAEIPTSIADEARTALLALSDVQTALKTLNKSIAALEVLADVDLD